MPDPKLQSAAKAIQKILQQEDVGGIILLASKTHSEYLMELSPSWSCIRFNPETMECRIRAVIKEFPSIEARNECIAHSCGLLLGLKHLAELMAKNMEKMMMVIGKHVRDIRHFDRDEGGPRYKFTDPGEADEDRGN
jgi:hypothetical protein